MATVTSRSLRQRLWIPLFAVACILAIMAVSAYRLGRIPFLGTHNSTSEDSGLSIAPDRLDFGRVWEDSHFTWVLPIENRRPDDVEIEAFDASCTCAALEPRSMVIPAGQKREVSLTLDLTANRSKLPDSEWRDFEVMVRPRLGGALQGIGSATWNVRGRVHTAVRFHQAALDLGRNSEAAQPLPPQKVLVTSFVPLQQLTARSNSPNLQVQVERSTDDPRRFELIISPGKLPIGPVELEIMVVPQSKDTRPLPGKTLPVTGWIVSDLQASPPEALFGARPVGEVAEETLTLSSLTNRHFEVAGVRAEGEGLSVDKAPGSIAGSVSYVVKQRITKTGEHAGKVVFRLKTQQGKAAEIAVAVSYLGIDSSGNASRERASQ